ncbi:MAG: hypothetical protein WAO58_02895 [Fimbriimonadaceae bacterium]
MKPTSTSACWPWLLAGLVLWACAGVYQQNAALDLQLSQDKARYAELAR